MKADNEVKQLLLKVKRHEHTAIKIEAARLGISMLALLRQRLIDPIVKSQERQG